MLMSSWVPLVVRMLSMQACQQHKASRRAQQAGQTLELLAQQQQQQRQQAGALLQQLVLVKLLLNRLRAAFSRQHLCCRGTLQLRPLLQVPCPLALSPPPLGLPMTT